MRNTTRTFAVAVVVSTLLSAPVFAAQSKAKSPRTQDEQSPIVRVIKQLKRLFDNPTVTQPLDNPTVTQPLDNPTVTQPH